MTEVKNCVIVAVDDSSASRAAYRWAASYARATATDVCAVHVLDWPIGLVGHPGEHRTRLCVPAQQVAPSYRRRLHRVLDDSVVDPAGDPALEHAMPAVAEPAIDAPADAKTDIDAQTASALHFAQGPVGEVLVRLSAHATLLVIGTREPLRDAHRPITGSATHYCVSHATCPVVTVPEPTRDTPAGAVDEVRRRVSMMRACAQA